MLFLVETIFKQMPTEETLALVPAETAHGKTLDDRGIRERLYVAADFSRAWQVFRSESLEALQPVLAGFPLAPFVDVTITPLAEGQ